MSTVQNLSGLAQYFQSVHTNVQMCRIGPLNMAMIMSWIFQDRLYFSKIMRTLVIHPEDLSTEFLTPIYANLQDKTVIQGSISNLEVQRLIKSHERIIMLGHGAQYGLLNPRQFPGAGLFIVDGSMVSSLKNKSNCIYIWCHANQFLSRYGLTGLCSGMFISETGEADLYGFEDIGKYEIDQSNQKFSSILSRHINEPLNVLYNSIMTEYEAVARDNPIARFNFQRLQLITESIRNNASTRLYNKHSMCSRLEDTENAVR